MKSWVFITKKDPIICEKKGNNNYIDIQAIQVIYQSEGQHRVAIAYRCFPGRRLLLRLRGQKYTLQLQKYILNKSKNK